MSRLAVALAVLAACSSKSEENGAPADSAERAVVVPDPEPAPPPVPASAPGLYTLADAPPDASLPITNASFLVVAADGAIHVGTTGKGTFPGQAIDRTAVVQAFAPPSGAEPARAAPPRPVAPKKPLPEPPISGLLGNITRSIPADAPLLLADGSRPAAEVIDIAADVARASLGVATAGDPAARVVAATLIYREQHTLDRAAVRVPLVAPADFATTLAVARAAASPQAQVIVEVAPEVTVTGLVIGLVALQRAQVDGFFLTTASLAARGVPDPHRGSGAIDAGRAVTVGEPQVTGPAAPAAIAKLVRARLGLLGACYHRTLVADRALAGALEVAFTIARTGKTAAVQVQGIGGADFQHCAARVFRAMRFARAKASSRVTLPLTFAVR